MFQESGWPEAGRNSHWVKGVHLLESRAQTKGESGDMGAETQQGPWEEVCKQPEEFGLDRGLLVRGEVCRFVMQKNLWLAKEEGMTNGVSGC